MQEGANFREIPMTKETRGCRIRPTSMVPSQEYRDNWDRIFNRGENNGRTDEIRVQDEIES